MADNEHVTEQDGPRLSTGVTLSKRTLLIISAVAVVVLLALAGTIGALAFNNGGRLSSATVSTSAEAAAIDEEAANASSEPNDEVLAPITPESSSTPTPEILPLNTQFVIAGATMTVTGAEVLQSIATVDGSTLAAEPGQQLVLVHTTYTVSGSAAVDLSCAGGDGTYIKAYDTDGNEMAPIFETSSIPGNPGCNEYLPHGATHTWNFAFTAAAGTKPAGLSIADSNTFGTTVLASLR
ncbi:hypothetical protein [Curtobacterium flaccumfaciens]|uniref:hypothetical protein n=1 Tax=Curtobacterium flaccumfaciens TaxID=2035 RepID=UPI003D9A1483